MNSNLQLLITKEKIKLPTREFWWAQNLKSNYLVLYALVMNKTRKHALILLILSTMLYPDGITSTKYWVVFFPKSCWLIFNFFRHIYDLIRQNLNIQTSVKCIIINIKLAVLSPLNGYNIGNQVFWKQISIISRNSIGCD